MKKAVAGFTLIEVLIALVIVAIALSSGLKMIGQYTINLGAIQDRTWAHWVAMNQIVNLQISTQWPSTEMVKGSEDETPYKFAWRREINETPYERVRRIEVQVFAEEDSEHYLVRLNSYTGRESGW